MPLWRCVAMSIGCFVILAACDDETGPEPVGLMWSSGASGAFVEDSVPLVVFYRDATGDPIGFPRPRLAWTSSNPSVMAVVSASLAVAGDTGFAVLTAVTQTTPTYSMQLPLRVVSRWTGRLVWSRQAQSGEQPGIAVQDFPSHDVRQLPDIGYPGAGSGDPSLSRDGSKVAVTGTRSVAPLADRTVFLVDMASGMVTAPFDTLPGHQFSAVWFPGDTLLAFLMGVATGWEVFTARPDGSGLQQRTTMRQSVPPFFDLTPDGSVVLQLRSGGVTTPSDLFEVTLAGDTVRRLTATPDYNEGGASVSPNGALVAYVASRVDDDFTHVWVMNRDGSAPSRLLPNARMVTGLGPPFYPGTASESSASWTPDGEWVLVAWNIDPLIRPDGLAYETRGELYAIRLSDGLRVRLTRSRMIDGQPVFR